MFKIGDFSKLSQVPVKTLRYYHQIGLLAPALIDEFTGYRYYTAGQLPRLNRILALKDLGFSLEQIGRLLDDSLSPEQMRGMLRLKQAEIERHLEREQDRLARVESRLRQIEQENKMPHYEVVLKKIEPIQAACLRDVVPNYGSVGRLLGELFGELNQKSFAPAGPPIALYYDEEYREQDVDVEVAVPVGGSPQAAGERVTFRDLPAGEMASLVRRGPYDDFSPAYQALMGWIQENGYRIAGPNREIYLQGPGEGIDPADYVTEIQFPVTK